MPANGEGRGGGERKKGAFPKSSLLSPPPLCLSVLYLLLPRKGSKSWANTFWVGPPSQGVCSAVPPFFSQAGAQKSVCVRSSVGYVRRPARRGEIGSGVQQEGRTWGGLVGVLGRGKAKGGAF